MADSAGGHFEIAIVGGGPAGLSAAIWSGRYLHSVVVLDHGEPRNWETLKVNGYLGLEAVTPAELRERGRRSCRALGVVLRDAYVLRAEQDDDGRCVLRVRGGTQVTADRLLLAFGLRDVWPEVPGMESIYGANAHVCPDCDGYDCRGKKVVVIGIGRRAAAMALNLTTWTSEIILCTNGRDPALDRQEYCDKLDALNIPVITERITRVCRDGQHIHCLMLENGMQLDADKVFFAIGQRPADDLGTQLGCDCDEEGRIIVDAHGHTSVRNVFAAGDITPGPQLAIAAAAAGAIAALAMHKSLLPDERKLSAPADEVHGATRPAGAGRAAAAGDATRSR